MNEENVLNHFQFPVTLGTIQMSWGREGLVQIEWSQNRPFIYQKTLFPSQVLDLADEIRSYFYQGEPLGPIPWHLIDQSDWTSFQKEVYQAVAKIPHGETETYGWVAKKIGNPKASRAVGQALRRNSLPILIPCHRVLAHSSMGGFMGEINDSSPEMNLKRRLMKIEEDYVNPMFSFLNSTSYFTNQHHQLAC